MQFLLEVNGSSTPFIPLKTFTLEDDLNAFPSTSF